MKLWPATLALGGTALGLVLPCIAPFVAVATLAARTLPLRVGLGTVAAMWFADQAIGFTWLRYPLNLPTLMLGVAIGVAAALATVVARSIASPALAFAAAFATYEAVEFLFALGFGGAGSFTARSMAENFGANVFSGAIFLVLRMALVRMGRPAGVANVRLG